MEGCKMFHMELLLKSVKLHDPNEANNSCPMCFSFRFPGIVDLEFCEGQRCGSSTGGTDIPMVGGKSCLFTVDSANLCRAVRAFYADVAVFRIAKNVQEMQLIAQTRLDFHRTFTEIIEMPEQPERMREIEKTLDLFVADHPKPVGTMVVHVRLRSQGSMVVTRFFRNANTNQLEFQSMLDVMPTDHSKKRKPCPKKCTKVCKVECGKVRCGKNKRRMETLVKALQMMKKMHQGSKNVPVTAGVVDQRCVFNKHCPIPECPFKLPEPKVEVEEEPVYQPVKAPTGKNAKNSKAAPPKKKPKPVAKKEKYDTDLFVLGVSHADPCKFKELVSNSIGTEYLDEDWIDMSVQPEVKPEPEPPKKSGKKNGKAAGKKSGKAVGKKKK